MRSDSVRERLRPQNADASLLNTSQASNRSAFEDPLSPVFKARYANDNQRLENIRIASLETRIKWHLVLIAALLTDKVVLNSSLASFVLLFGSFSDFIVSSVVSFAIFFFSIIIVCLLFEMKFPAVLNTAFQRNFSSRASPMPAQFATPTSHKKVLDTSSQSAEHSWVDAHRFGTPSVKGQTSPTDRTSPVFVNVLNTSLLSDVSGIFDENSSVGWKSPSSYGKSTESIHTRKQLDVLLRSNRADAPIDMNASQSYFSSIFSVFDLSRRGGNHGNNSYQVSEEITEDTSGNCSYRMKIGKNGRTEVKMLRRGKDGETEEEDDDELARLHKIMNSAKSVSEAKAGILKRSNSIDRGSMRGRRRSHSSPERTTGSENEIRFRTAELLSEEQQKRAEFLTRAWIRNTIILPLTAQIDQVNKMLDKEHATPPLRIGSSSVDALKLAAIERDVLKSSNLPFLLPFLSVHTNQAYLVSRLKELSATQFMDAYKWNSGGSEPTEEQGQATRLIRREWNESLPTDAMLVFDLFLAYMDTQVNSNCLVGDSRLDQPFTSRFVVKHPRKPTSIQRAPFSFYLHVASLAPPHIEFVHNDQNGSASKCQVLRQNPNVFRAIAQFVHYAKHENHGYLDQTAIGPSGINLTLILA